MSKTTKVSETSARILFEEAKWAYDQLDRTVENYRTRVSLILSAITAAAGIFAFADSEKGKLFYAALAAYFGAIVLGMLIHKPLHMKSNISKGAVDVLKSKGPKIPPAKIYIDLADGYQSSLIHNHEQINSRYGLASKFNTLLVLVALTTGLMITNIAADSTETPEQPIRVILESDQP